MRTDYRSVVRAVEELLVFGAALQRRGRSVGASIVVVTASK
jgi:hypothetical protein